jgi:hypothetical protein
MSTRPHVMTKQEILDAKDTMPKKEYHAALRAAAEVRNAVTKNTIRIAAGKARADELRQFRKMVAASKKDRRNNSRKPDSTAATLRADLAIANNA